MAWPIIAAAVAGAAIGGISTMIAGNKQAAAYEQQAENAWQRYLINKEFAGTQFSLQKSEALTGLGIQKQRLGEDLAAGVEQFNTGLLGQAYGIQDAQINLAGQLGSYDVAQAASGTRGNEASGLVKAYARTSLDRNIALQDEQNAQTLGGMVTQANRGNTDIKREQDSWGETGYRTQLYNAEDERNRKLAQLQQDEYSYAASASQPGVFDFLTGGLMGASTGLNLAGNVQNAMQFSGQSGTPSYLQSPTVSQAPSLNLSGNQFQMNGLSSGMSFNNLGGLAYNPYAGRLY